MDIMIQQKMMDEILRRLKENPEVMAQVIGNPSNAQPPKFDQELSFEEELELGKKQYYEEQKRKQETPVRVPSLEEQRYNELAARMNAYNLSAGLASGTGVPGASKKNILEPPVKAVGMAGPKKEKVKLKIEWPFGKKSSTKSLLEEEEKKWEMEEAARRQKYGA